MSSSAFEATEATHEAFYRALGRKARLFRAGMQSPTGAVKWPSNASEARAEGE